MFNLKSGQEVAKQKTRLAISNLAVDDSRYWKNRLFNATYTRNGEKREVKEFSVRMQKAGRRHAFNLHTANREKAAKLAADISGYLLSHTWEETLNRYGTEKPNPRIEASKVTLGDYIKAAEAVFERKQKTFRLYATYLRKITADIAGIDGGKARFDHKTGGQKAWQQKVDAIRLTSLTPGKLQEWKVGFVKLATDPAARKSSERSANSYLRCARSLFSPRIMAFVAEKIELPDPMPFAGMKIEKPSPSKYKSRIDTPLLITAARNELREQEPAAYAIFLLAIGAGLRKGEIDTLQWHQVNFDRHTIRLEISDIADLKTDESADEVEIDAAGELQRLRDDARSLFVIPSTRPHRANLTGQYYRCEPAFERLYAWLRSKGITDKKPLHLLRKEFGSLINQQFGLYAASAILRHRNIATTAGHYVANKGRVSLSLDDLLNKPTLRIVDAA